MSWTPQQVEELFRRAEEARAEAEQIARKMIESGRPRPGHLLERSGEDAPERAPRSRPRS